MEKLPTTPTAYSSVCPYLMVDNVVKQIEFLQGVFGAKEKERIENPEGEIFHGEVYIGEVAIMIGKSRPDWPSREGMVYVFVEDVNQTYNTALDHKAEPVMAPGDRDYGLREAEFKDEQRNQWWIAQSLS